MGKLPPILQARRDAITDFVELELAYLYSIGATPSPKKPAASPAAGVAEDQPHVTKEAKIEGNLFKGNISGKVDATYYSFNGWNYIALNRGNTYKEAGTPRGYKYFDITTTPNFNPEYKRAKLKKAQITKQLAKLAQNKTASKASLKLLRALRAQCKKSGKTGQSIPYPWDAHHILPMEAFYKYLPMKHIRIIQRGTYDINTGQNMIFLPASESDMGHHQLPAHVDNHPKYTLGLKTEFNKIKAKLDGMKGKPHDQVTAAMESQLHSLEDRKYKEIDAIGATRLL
jgi:A nuclease family of the HNH/ENDO VII superfamily with conserved AHH